MKIKIHPIAVGCILMLWSLFAIAASPAPIPKATPKPTPKPGWLVLFRVSGVFLRCRELGKVRSLEFVRRRLVSV